MSEVTDVCKSFGKNWAGREIGERYISALFHLVCITVEIIAKKAWVIEVELIFKVFSVLFKGMLKV